MSSFAIRLFRNPGQPFENDPNFSIKIFFYKHDENNKMDQCLDFKSFFFIDISTKTRDKNQEKKRRGYCDLEEYSKLQWKIGVEIFLCT